MATEEIKQYYDATRDSKARSDLLFSIGLVKGPKIAIDCGCGAGSDIEYLVSSGFFVHGFDVEEESISRCQARFKGNKNVALSQDTFSSFSYPKASLVLADASLFFCPEGEFEYVWSQLYECLDSGGIFCGSFLGADDTMAGPGYDKVAFWSDVLVFDHSEVIEIFNNYDICRFTEHKSSGKAPGGEPHHWHIFSVVARKPGE